MRSVPPLLAIVPVMTVPKTTKTPLNLSFNSLPLISIFQTPLALLPLSISSKFKYSSSSSFLSFYFPSLLLLSPSFSFFLFLFSLPSLSSFFLFIPITVTYPPAFSSPSPSLLGFILLLLSPFPSSYSFSPTFLPLSRLSFLFFFICALLLSSFYSPIPFPSSFYSLPLLLS